jgi:Chloroplast envelope transporter
MSPFFKPKVLIRPNLLELLTRKRLAQNYEIEVNNLLADNLLFSITQAHVRSITLKQSADTIKKSSGMMSKFYKQYLRFCIKDKLLTREALEELDYLKHILSLSESDVGEVHNTVIGGAYQSYVDRALLNNKIDKEGKVDTTKDDLKLSTELSARIQQQVKEKYLRYSNFRSESGQMLSPEEEDQLENISRSLQIQICHGDNTKSKLDKLKLYWVIENCTLPQTKCSILLDAGERCYFQSPCTWHEGQTSTKSEESDGARIIMKGVKYKIGSNQSNHFSVTELAQRDSGTLCLTNERIIFAGKSSMVRIKLTKIPSFEPFVDYIKINKEAGQSPVIRLDENAELFCLILSKLINEI